MEKRSKLHAFAVKWLNKFNDPEVNYIDLVDHYMGDECSALGFEMDCGNAFCEKYGEAVHNASALTRIIDNVNDIPLLGSAIFSRWRYFNHWAYSGSEILEPENRAWFLTALSRLAALAANEAVMPLVLTGNIKKIRICSNSICYGPMPSPDEEVEQHLTITRDGRVFFTSYVYGECDGKYRKSRTINFKTATSKVSRIMASFEKYFSEPHEYPFVTDIGGWKMEITNTDGEIFPFCGSLCLGALENGVDLSELVRDELSMQNLLVFDGNSDK